MDHVLTINGVRYYKSLPEELIKIKQLEEELEWIHLNVDETLQQAQALYDDMKDNELTIGMVEAEGFLRCAKTISNIIGSMDRKNDE